MSFCYYPFDSNLSLFIRLEIILASPDSVHSTPKPRQLVLGFGRVKMIATVVIIVLTLLNVIVYKLRQIQEANLAHEFNISQSEQSCRRFSLAEIQSATYHFDDALVLGKGGFGKVYKGVIDNGATTVAIKRLNPMSKQGAPEFWREIEMLSKIRHIHIVSLIGYCNQRNEMILVYEYMVRGTIADHLHKNGRNGGDNSILSWVERLKICIGAARGLDYLHTGMGVKERVIHRDVKSSNILLDENWAAKISDFGLSKIGPANQSTTYVSTNVKGTIGYLDIEYFLTHRLTRKSDVYAFGVVLFEVLCGRPAVDFRLDVEQCGLAGWAHRCIKEGKLYQIIDPDLSGQILPDSLAVFEQIADQCLHKFSKKRPTMAEVVVSLERALALQERIDSSMLEGEIFDIGGAFFNQENADSYMKENEDINADSFIEQQEVINAGNDYLHEELIDGIRWLGDANNEQKQIDENADSPREQPKVIINAGNGVEQIDRIMLLGDANNSQSHFFGKAQGTSEALPRSRRRKSETFRTQYINTKELKISVGTWNVGGLLPPNDLDIEEWLDISEPSDIYVLGFQEIIPLNAGNMFGSEDSRPVPIWENIIREALNKTQPAKTKFKCYSDPPSPSRFKPSDDAPDLEDEILLETASDGEEEIYPLNEETNGFDEVRDGPVLGEYMFMNAEASVSSDDSNLGRSVEQELERQLSSPKRLGRLNCLRTEDSAGNAEESVPLLNSKLTKTLSGTTRVGLSWPEPPLDLLAQCVSEKPNSFRTFKSFKASKSFKTYNSFKSSVNTDNRAQSGEALSSELDLESLMYRKKSSYVRIVSKQMVGVFLTIWVHRSLRRHIQNINVSTVGVGVLRFIGNKGSISVSMSIYQTLFCFICTHLTAGEKDGDAVKRNADVHIIHQKTRFNSLSSIRLPKSIHDHEKIIWLGDLNYRINLSYDKTRELISKGDWSKLVERDQLIQELKKGRAFDGWSEGPLKFPPTYKYEFNSEKYYGEDPKIGRRTPAWCDRILSFGHGMKLLSYKRTELRLSDHRPVTASYLVEVEVFSPRRLQKALTFTDAEIEDDNVVSIMGTNDGISLLKSGEDALNWER